ncbi:hypothetical protein T484DRAFT_1648426, partial [Baffinella frigidus]
PKPFRGNPPPETLHPKPSTLHPKPQTRNQTRPPRAPALSWGRCEHQGGWEEGGGGSGRAWRRKARLRLGSVAITC